MLANDKKEQDRLENCGLVIQEIMDIPDDIPQDLIDKADCIIVYPSVLKGAFIFGGSYGRGAMTCRSTSLSLELSSISQPAVRRYSFEGPR